MTAAYVDSSCFVSLAMGERAATAIGRRLAAFDELLSSNLLEAELRSAFKRENAAVEVHDLIAGISWIYPDRPLTAEFETVLHAGHVRGADLWHLAAALFIDPEHEISFLTLDTRQKHIADTLGFPV